MLHYLKKLVTSNKATTHFFSETSTDTANSDQKTDDNYLPPETIDEAYNNPRYQGKYVVETPEGLFSSTKPQNAVSHAHKMEKKHGTDKVISTFIPKGMLVSVPVQLKK